MREEKIKQGIRMRRDAGLPEHFCRGTVVAQYIDDHPEPGKHYYVPVCGKRTQLLVCVRGSGILCLKYSGNECQINMAELVAEINKNNPSLESGLVRISVGLSYVIVQRETIQKKLSGVLKTKHP